jgi:hypothetical protein
MVALSFFFFFFFESILLCWRAMLSWCTLHANRCILGSDGVRMVLNQRPFEIT